MDPLPRFWRSLLLERGEARWGNFTWLSPTVLLQSANDQVSKYLDSTIVNRRRMRWVAAKRANGANPDEPIHLTEVMGGDPNRIILLGDPGEMDASQYVLLRDLFETAPAALLLMTDIVYPAGNINAWRDAVYLPYFGLHADQWRAAVDGWKDDDPSALDGDGNLKEEDRPAPPAWPVFAMPGNHDWYDGLTGFMFHACGLEALPNLLYSNEGMTRQQALSRVLWRRSARPNRAVIDPLRLEAAENWDSEQRPGPIPFQPGPYFTILLDRKIRRGRRHALRVICVDTGIDGSIDVEQAIWLREQLKVDGLPKVIVTGKPLVVDQKMDRFPIEGGETMDPSRDGDPETRRGYKDVRDLIQGHRSVIACISGDVHNAQRLVLSGREVSQRELRSLWSPRRPRGTRPPIIKLEGQPPIAVEAKPDPPLPPLHFVAGGGGAYLTETHRVKLDHDDGLTIKDKRGKLDDVTVPKGRHTRYPSREQSAMLFAREVDGWICFLVLLVVGIAFGAAGQIFFHVAQPNAVRPEAADLSIFAWRAAIAAFGAAGLLVLCPIALVSKDGIKALLKPIIFLLTATFSGMFVFGLWDGSITDGLFVIGGAVFAVAIPFALVAAPLMRAYPSLRKLLPIRAAVAAGVAALVVDGQPALVIFGAIAAAVAIYLILKGLRSAAQEKVRDLTLRQTGYGWRLAYLVSSSWPLFAIAALITLAPKKLFHFAADGIEFVHMIGAGVLLLFVAGLTYLGLRSLAQAWRTAPIYLPILMAAGAATAALGSIWWLEEIQVHLFGGDQNLAEAARAVLLGIGGATVMAGLLMMALGSKDPDPKDPEGEVGKALRARDVGGKCPRNMRLFRVMAVAGLPMIGQIAESTSPPFHKSFLEIELEDGGQPDVMNIVFTIYGVNDDRPPGRKGHPFTFERNVERGSFPVDETVVSIPLDPPMRRWERERPPERRQGRLSPP